jgi:glycerol-3-phosphate dehydrogenase
MKPLKSSQVDLAIVGGGINGAGLALLAAKAGLSVALFEKDDFASGTSSKSTKLIHGGIRYLEQYRFSLVFESLHERQKLLKLAPHLIHPISILLPCYKTDRRPPWMLKIGLWLYDILAGSSNIARHRWYSAEETKIIAPTLKTDGLKGCGLYYDAQVNDARLVLENILAAEEAGADCLNYCCVNQIDREEGFVRVFFQESRTKENGVLQAKCLVNAAGPWANQITKLISENALSLIRPTRGSHIVMPEVLSQHAVLIMTPKDNRIIFIVPWRGFSLVGTTDLDDPDDPNKVAPTEEEIQYLLREASRVFPGSIWDRNQVLSAFSGLRPLAWSGGEQASSLSREDKIQSEGNVISIVGGKLTTYRSMAEKAMRKILKITGQSKKIPRDLKLPGSIENSWDEFLKKNVPQWISTFKISESQANHLAGLYGQKARDVLALIEKDARFREPLHADRPELSAQVVYAVLSEKACHLEDVMLRRLEIGYSPQRWGSASEKASRLMAEQLGWDETNRLVELEHYRQSLFPTPDK